MLIKKIVSGILAFLLLILFNLSVEKSCYSIVIIFIVTMIILKNSYDLYFHKKLCVANCFFNQNSSVYTITTGKTFSLIVSFIVSIVLSMTLMLSIASYTDNFVHQMGILFIDIFILIILYTIFIKNKIIKNDINHIFITNFTAFVNAILLSIIFMFGSLNEKSPSYIDNDLKITIQNASVKTVTQCESFENLLLISNGIDGMKKWLLLNYQLNFASQNYLLIFLVLIGNFTMAFAYGRYILAITNLHNNPHLKKENGKEE